MRGSFVIWSVLAVVFVGLGIWSWRAEKQVNFWANTKSPEMKDVKKYNRAIAKIWFTFAVVYEALGIPLQFCEQNSPVFLLTIVGLIFLVIGIMGAYMAVENKYRKR